MTARKTVEDYLKSKPAWRKELTALRAILVKHDMEETIKWGMPVYVAHGRNVVGISGFKSYFGLWFYDGFALQDKAKILINAQEGKTQSMRQWRMTSAEEIDPKAISTYVREAIAIAKKAKPAPKKKKVIVVLPPDLKRVLSGDPDTEKAFNALTPGKRRDYADYIAEAKRAETRLRRLEKIIPMIKAGVGLNDRYQ